MTFISSASTSGSTYTSPTLVAGDIVVLCVGGDSGVYGNQNATFPSWSGPIATPPGWEIAAGPDNHLLTAPIGYGFSTHAVFWRRATGTSLSASFGRPLLIHSVVLRAVTSIAGVQERTINASDFTYPALSFEDPMTGHVIHFGSAPGSTPAPAASGDTARQAGVVSVGGSEAQKIKNRVGAPIAVHAAMVTTERAFTAVSSVAAATSGTRRDGWAASVAFATVSGPPAPAITAPLAGSVDLAAGFTIEWTPSGAQTGFAIRRKLGAGAWAWWNGTDWSASSETIVTSTATTVAVPAAQFSNGGSSYTIEVATVGDALRPSLGTYASVVVVGKAPPTLSSATVSPLTGSNVTSLTPTVTLSGAAGSGGSLTGYRVRVDQDLGAGWVQVLDSGTVASPWTVSVAQAANLTNGAPIRFRSVTVQDGAQESAVTTSATYTLAAPTPAAPTVAAAQVVHPVSGLPGLRVTINSGASGTINLYRDGVHIHTSAIVAGFPLIVDDYSPGAGPTVYTATTTTGDGVTTVLLTSPIGTAAAISVTDSGENWLIDPLDPSTAVIVTWQAEEELVHGTRTAVFQPLAEDGWYVHTGGRVRPAAGMTLLTLTPAARDAALALLCSGKRLELKMLPESDGNCTKYPTPPISFRVSGDITESRLVQMNRVWRVLTFPYVTQ